MYVRHSFPPWPCVVLLHFSHDLSKWSSPFFSSTTFQKNFQAFLTFLKCSSVSTRQSYAPIVTFTSYCLKLECNLLVGRARSEPGGTRWRRDGELKGKLANGVGSQYSHATSERGISSINQADAHTSAASSRLNWRPHRFKWTRPFWGKTKSGFCACAITFRTSYTAFFLMDAAGRVAILDLISRVYLARMFLQGSMCRPTVLYITRKDYSEPKSILPLLWFYRGARWRSG